MGRSRKLTLEMFFDATSTQDGSVVQAVEQLFSCCVPTEESAGQKKPSPPIVVLHWGQISSFPAFVTSVSAKYTLFNGQGLPIRALVSVAMEEMPGEPFRQNPTSGSQDVRRVHRTIAGDTLASVVRRVRRPDAVAGAGRVQRHRRPDARPHRHHPAAARPGGAGGRAMSTTSTALVEIEVRPSRTTSFPCSRRRTSTTASGLDMFSLRFRDPARIVLSKTNAKIGAKVKISVMTAEAQTPNR